MSKTIQEVKDNLELSKQRTQALIDQANATTGNEDTDLTSAVGALVEGFGQGGSGGNSADNIISGAFDNIITNVDVIRSYAFYQSSSLKSIKALNATNLGTSAFHLCVNLTEAVIPNVTELKYGRVFSGCSSLESISIPLVSSISGYAVFSECSSLKNVNLPSLTTITQGSVFSDCKLLEVIKFPSLKIMKNTQLFKNCTNLTTLILPYKTSIVTLENTNNFSNTPIESGTGYIYVPQALIEEYKVATNWSIFADQFRAIEDYPEICGGDA